MIATSVLPKIWPNRLLFPAWIYALFVSLHFCNLSTYCQDFNFHPAWIVVETEEVVPYPELLPVNNEMNETLVSSIMLYKSSFAENYDSTLFFVLNFDMIQDSAILTLSKHSFSWYSIYLRQYYESAEDRPIGSFELAGILFIVENRAKELINRFFKVKTGVNRISVKSRKLIEPGVYNERQTFRIKYEIVDDSLRLIDKKIEAYKLKEIEMDKY